VDKGGVLKGARNTNSLTPFNGLGVYDNGSVREVSIGGGSWGSPDATVVNIYAGPYNETNDGAGGSIMEINGNKHVSIGESTSSSIIAGTLRVIDSSSAYKGIVLSNTTTNGANKIMTIGCGRLNNANSPFTAFGGYDNGLLRTVDIGGSLYSSSPGSNIIDFWTAPSGSLTESRRMRIWHTGAVLIGLTSPSTSASAPVLQVNGPIGSTSTSLVGISDIKYKKNIYPFSGGLNIINNLSPKTFSWKENQGLVTAYNPTTNQTETLREAYSFSKGVQVGFIAQEVQQIISGEAWSESIIKPSVRSPVYGFTGELLAEEEKYLAIAEGNLITILTSAIKELSLEVNNLKSKVWHLESNISNN
jgi:hypothetical protein